MKKNLLYSLISISFPVFSFATQDPTTCEDIGARTQTEQIFIDIGVKFPIGEPRRFCVLYEDQMQSLILESSLLSKNSNLAATAYRNGPTPIIDKKERADRAYCKTLGGTFQYGSIGITGGWKTDKDDGVSSVCVFADGSMISTWTLFYKRVGASRPDFEPFFQNRVIPANLW